MLGCGYETRLAYLTSLLEVTILPNFHEVGNDDIVTLVFRTCAYKLQSDTA